MSGVDGVASRRRTAVMGAGVGMHSRHEALKVAFSALRPPPSVRVRFSVASG